MVLFQEIGTVRNWANKTIKGLVSYLECSEVVIGQSSMKKGFNYLVQKIKQSTKGSVNLIILTQFTRLDSVYPISKQFLKIP